MVETIISTSPLLERLKLDDCDGIDHLNIHTHNLKYLYVNVLESICFKQSPNLTEITIRSDLMLEDSENSKMSNLIQLFDAAPKIEKLFLEVNSLKFLAAGGVPDRLSTPANQLKILMLSPINFSDFDLLSLTLCLIRSSPNLQKLEIGASACKKAVADLAIIFLDSHWAEYSLEQLRIVKINLIGNITGRSRPELELIKILLARSPSA
ncbi:hypothetical protein L1049_007242 [Liquidambar formosana]|uniref:F-box/LRR-repeat protein 15/At3g58940/PEG3-like LRR domain-containing protein n=1 Tax=Liquidambar formosana TaxID=63359 RepID=A0AAP0RGX1_LIQFO